MTDEQKLQWLQSLLAKGIQVGQINLGNGVQNIQINALGQTALSQDKPKERTGHLQKRVEVIY